MFISCEEYNIYKLIKGAHHKRNWMLMKFEFLLIKKIHYNGHDKTTHFITQIKTDILKRAYNVHLTYTSDSPLKV